MKAAGKHIACGFVVTISTIEVTKKCSEQYTLGSGRPVSHQLLLGQLDRVALLFPSNLQPLFQPGSRLVQLGLLQPGGLLFLKLQGLLQVQGTGFELPFFEHVLRRDGVSPLTPQGSQRLF